MSDRLDNAIGLIFAIIAFQFVVAGQIPNLPYLTIVDKYNLAVFVFVLILLLESVVVGWREGQWFDEDQTEAIDNLFLGLLSGVWLLFHIMFVSYVYLKMQAEVDKIGRPFDHTHGQQTLASYFGSELKTIPWKGSSKVA